MHHRPHGGKEKPLHHFNPNVNSSLELMDEFSKMDVFGGGTLGKGFDILSQAKEEGAKIFVSLAGAMVPGGMRMVIVEAMKHGLIDLLVTTGANITHDLIEAFGKPHLVAVSFKDDKDLRDRGIDRVYDSFVDAEGFPALEDMMKELIVAFYDEHQQDDRVITSSHEFLKWLGHKIEDKQSIVKVAAEMNIPIFVPVIADSILGLQIWIQSQFKKIIMDEMADLTAIQDFFANSDKTCAFIIGGGVPKNYMLQSSLMSAKEYEYGVAITMDRVETGGLSGATLEEAVSWGKFSWEAPKTTIYADTTIVLPLIVSAWIEQYQAKS